MVATRGPPVSPTVMVGVPVEVAKDKEAGPLSV